MAYIITVGNNAQSFHDHMTGITVCRGEKVEIRGNQYTSPRIRQALSTGHLVLVPESNDKVEVTPKEVISKLDKKIANQFNKGMSIEKISNGVTLEQAKQIATLHDVTVEDSDTVIDILSAILEE